MRDTLDDALGVSVLATVPRVPGAAIRCSQSYGMEKV